MHHTRSFHTVAIALICVLHLVTAAWPPIHDIVNTDWRPFYTHYSCKAGAGIPPIDFGQDSVKSMIDSSVDHKKVDKGSDPYYGIWLSEYLWGPEPRWGDDHQQPVVIEITWSIAKGLKKGDWDRASVLKITTAAEGTVSTHYASLLSY